MNDTELFVRIRDKATDIFRDYHDQSLSDFLYMLAEVYEALDPDNDYDLDIG